MEGRCKSVGAVREPPLLPGIDQVDGMAFVAGLGPGMGLVALVTSFHAWPVRSRRKGIVLDVAMAIDADSFFLGMKFMGNLHNPHILQVCLFSPGNSRMAAQTTLVHQVITGRKLEGKDPSGFRVAIHTSHRCRMAAGGKPHLPGILILMTAQADKGVTRGEAHQPQTGDGRQDDENGDDQCPGTFGQFGKRRYFHNQPLDPLRFSVV